MGDEDFPSTAQCQFCSSEVPARSLVIHEAQCRRQRHISKCKFCGEAIPRSSLEAHETECGMEIACTHCGEEIKKNLLQDHEDTCPKRKVLCMFCALEVLEKDSESHFISCGSRTDECDKCGRRLQLKDFALHEESNCELPVPEAPRTDPYQNMSPEDQIDRLRELSMADHDYLMAEAALLNRPVLKLSDKPKSKGPRESKPAKTQIPSYTSPTSMSKDKVSKPINDKDFLSSLLQTKPIAKPVQPKNKTLVPAKPSVVSAQPPPKSPSPLNQRPTYGLRVVQPDSVNEFQFQTLGTQSSNPAPVVAAKPSAKLQPSPPPTQTVRKAPERAPLPLRHLDNVPVSSFSGGGEWDCEMCGHPCADYEEVQIHLLTTCPHREEYLAELEGSGRVRTPPSPVEINEPEVPRRNPFPVMRETDISASAVPDDYFSDRPDPNSASYFDDVFVPHQGQFHSEEEAPARIQQERSPSPPNEVVMIPCEFCGDDYPMETIMGHSLECQEFHGI